MKYVLSLLLLLALSTGCLAQCGCSVLRLAMDDKRSYRYRCYKPAEHDTTIEQLDSLQQARYQWGLLNHANVSAKERQYVSVNLSGDAPRRVYIEVTEVVSQKRMLLSLRFPFSDSEAFNLILHFDPGQRYHLVLDQDSIPGFKVVSSEPRSDATYWLRLHRK